MKSKVVSANAAVSSQSSLAKAGSIMTCLLSAASTASILLLCYQFKANGEVFWMWTTLVFMVAGNVLFTTYVLVGEHNQPYFKNWHQSAIPTPIRFLMLLPFAQFVSVGLWVYQNIINNPSNSDCGTVADEYKVPSEWSAEEIKPEIAKEVATVAGSFYAMGRLERVIKEHLKNHIFFYVEAIVVFTPQIVIQLLAITFIDAASTIQSFLLILLIITVLSKGFVIASSQSIAVVIWKLSCIGADLFGLFYIFSSIMDRSAPQEAHLFGLESAPMVSYLTFLFSLKWAMFVGVPLAIFTSTCLYAAVFKGRTLERRMVTDWILMAIVALVLLGPAIVGVEAAKLIIFVYILSLYEPVHSKAASALIYAYIYNDGSSSQLEQNRKAKQLIHHLAHQHISKNVTQAPSLMENQLLFWTADSSDDESDVSVEADKRRAKSDQLLHDINSLYGNLQKNGVRRILDIANSADFMISAGTDYATYERLRNSSSKGEVQSCNSNSRGVVTKRAHRRPFFLAGIDRIVQPASVFERSLRLNFRNCSIEEFMLLIVIGLFFIGQTFSTVFPVVNALMNYSSLSGLQIAFFACHLVSLAAVIVTSKSAVTYLLYNMRFNTLRGCLPVANNVASVYRAVEQDYFPTLLGPLGTNISNEGEWDK